MDDLWGVIEQVAGGDGPLETPAFDPIALGLCTPKQREALEDPVRHRIWVAGRGSGKTTAACFAMLIVATALPDVLVLYVNTTFDRAMATVWEKLKTLNRDHGLGAVAFESGELDFGNGSRLVLTGIGSKKLADQWRGPERLAMVVPDEGQDYDPELLQYMVGSVFLPRLNDPGVRGRLLVCGTGSRPKGYYHRAFSDRSLGFGAKTWLYSDNPLKADPESELREALQTLGVGIDDPFIRREYFAEFNVGGVGQILKLGPSTLIKRADLPRNLDHFVVAADFGTVDACAVHVTGFSNDLPDRYTVETRKDYALGASGQVAFVRQVVAEYKPRGRVYVVGDGGGLGKALVIDLQKTEGFYAVEPAEKANKAPAMRNLAAALFTGRHKVPEEEQDFRDDLAVPEWDPDHYGERIKGHVPDKVDAALYGERKAATVHRYRPPPPPPTDPAEILLAKIREQEALRAAARNRSRWK